MEARFDPDHEMAFVVPSPNGRWQHFDELFRNDAQMVRRDEAVRTFLTPTEFSVHEDGIYLGQRRFWSKDLEESDVLAGGPSTKHVATKINGYVLDMCVRHVWIEAEGRLLELDAKLRTRGDEQELWVSLAELAQWQEARRAVASAFRVHKRATASDYMQRFEETTGKKWDGGTRKLGKPKQDAAAKQEAAEAAPFGGSRNAA